MKRLIVIGILFCCNISAGAQLKTTVRGKPNSFQLKNVQPAKTKDENDTVISLTSNSSYAAKTISLMSVHTNYVRISDPVVVAFAERAKGKEIYISKSGIVGMPKRAYGFANGRILFHSTVATSSGSTGGSCSVGTGGSISGMGGSGSFIGLNGKSPYAGQGMWGNAIGLTINSPIR